VHTAPEGGSKMKYRIHENKSGQCKIQKKDLFGWVWLDVCKKWCNWYGRKNPCVFKNRKEAQAFADNDTYKTITYYPYSAPEGGSMNKYQSDLDRMVRYQQEFRKAKQQVHRKNIIKRLWNNVCPIWISVPIIIISLIAIYFEIQFFCIRFGWC
jgi:hypothetical protein